MPQAVPQLDHQELLREVNERVREISASFTVAAPSDDGCEEYLCECADPECEARVRIDAAAYERARSSRDRFVVLPEHAAASGAELERGAAYVIVRRVTADAASH